MTIILKPRGRGNWKATVVTISVAGGHLGPLLMRRGELITLGGVVFRIAEIRA